MELGAYRNLFEAAYYAIYLLGVPIVVIKAYLNYRQYLRLAEQKMYTDVNDKYIEFLNIAIAYPKLSVTEFSRDDEDLVLSREEKIQQNILYDILTSIFERAFFLHEPDKNTNSIEWSTWDAWMDRYIAKNSYAEFLEQYALYGCFEKRFQSYLTQKIEARKRKRPA
jgi:hypothetical protein